MNAYTVESEALLNYHMEANHTSNKSPITVIFKGFDMFGRRIPNEKSENEQVDKSVDTDNDVDDEEEDEDKDDTPSTHVWRCNYGLCDLQQISFETKGDLKTHLENQHWY